MTKKVKIVFWVIIILLAGLVFWVYQKQSSFKLIFSTSPTWKEDILADKAGLSFPTIKSEAEINASALPLDILNLIPASAAKGEIRLRGLVYNNDKKGYRVEFSVPKSLDKATSFPQSWLLIASFKLENKLEKTVLLEVQNKNFSAKLNYEAAGSEKTKVVIQAIEN